MSEKYVKVSDIVKLIDRHTYDDNRIDEDITVLLEDDEVETVELPKWHDLRENPEDLPKYNKEVLVEDCDVYYIAYRTNKNEWKAIRRNEEYDETLCYVTKWMELPKDED